MTKWALSQGARILQYPQINQCNTPHSQIEMIFLIRVTNLWIKVTGQHFLKLKEIVKKNNNNKYKNSSCTYH